MTGAGITALVAAGVTFQTANASETPATPEPRLLSALAAGKLGSTLGEDLGADAAGIYYDAQSKSLVVNVLDKAAAKTVEAAGAEARLVQNSLAELTSARTTLKKDATIKEIEATWRSRAIATSKRERAYATVQVWGKH